MFWYRRDGSFEAIVHAARDLEDEEILFHYSPGAADEYAPIRRAANYQAGQPARLRHRDVPRDERPI
jgi:hypothetical protein